MPAAVSMGNQCISLLERQTVERFDIVCVYRPEECDVDSDKFQFGPGLCSLVCCGTWASVSGFNVSETGYILLFWDIR